MRTTLIAAILAASTAALAQDRITLTNGDVLTGTIKTMADGKVTITSPLMGDVVVPIADIGDMATKDQIALQTVDGQLYKRRVAGLEKGQLHLDGDMPTLAIDSLSKINPPPPEQPRWTGTMQIGGSFTDGNTQHRSVGSTIEASRRTEQDRITFDASWDYSQDKDRNATSPTFGQWKLNQRRAGGGLKYDYFVNKRWYLLATGRVLGDTLADINLRFIGGAGLGYTVIDNDTTNLLTEVGLSYFNENYRSNTPSNDYVAARVAYKLTHALSEKTKLVHGTEAFPSLEQADDVYLQMKTEVVTKLAGDMIASLSWVMDYDNTPAPGRERTDHRVLLSIGWSF